MIGWESGLFIVVVGGVFVVGITLLRLIVRLGCLVYAKVTGKRDATLPG